METLSILSVMPEWISILFDAVQCPTVPWGRIKLIGRISFQLSSRLTLLLQSNYPVKTLPRLLREKGLENERENVIWTSVVGG